MKCNFCEVEGNWKNVLRNPEIQKKDGSDVVLCDVCLNLYANHDFEELTKRLPKEREAKK